MNDVGNGITWEALLVTPDQARIWFNDNGLRFSDLPIKEIQHHAHEMKSNRWEMNGEPIIFSDEGKLLDGKRRLASCMSAGVPFPALILRGVDRHSAATIDDHRKRRAGDILYISGIENGSVLAHTATAINAFASGKSGITVNGATVARFREMDADFEASIMRAKDMKASEWGTRASIAAGIFLFGKSDRDLAELFFKKLDDESDNSGPWSALRTALKGMNEKGAKKDARYIGAYLIKAWNAAHAGAQIKRLVWSPDDGESFPSIAGLPTDLLLPNMSKAVVEGTNDYRQLVHTNEISVEIATVTPNMAEKLLQSNGPSGSGRNRRISNKIVKKYVRDMQEGRWKLNGQSIKLSVDGRILDGQHRLRACMVSSRPFKTVLVRGLPDDIFVTLDQGRRKGVAETLKGSGLTYTTSVAATASYYWQIFNGGIGTGETPTTLEVHEVIDANPGLLESTRFCGKPQMRIIGSSAPMAAIHYLLTQRDPDKAHEFFNSLSSGAGLEANHPILALRNKLIMDKNGGRTKLVERTRVAMFAIAWRHWIEGKPLYQFRIPDKMPTFFDNMG